MIGTGLNLACACTVILHQRPNGSHVTSAYHHVRCIFFFFAFSTEEGRFSLKSFIPRVFHGIFFIPRMNIADIKNYQTS